MFEATLEILRLCILCLPALPLVAILADIVDTRKFEERRNKAGGPLMAAWASHGNIADVLGDPGLVAVVALVWLWVGLRSCRAYPLGLSAFSRLPRSRRR